MKVLQILEIAQRMVIRHLNNQNKKGEQLKVNETEVKVVTWCILDGAKVLVFHFNIVGEEGVAAVCTAFAADEEVEWVVYEFDGEHSFISQQLGGSKPLVDQVSRNLCVLKGVRDEG